MTACPTPSTTPTRMTEMCVIVNVNGDGDVDVTMRRARCGSGERAGNVGPRFGEIADAAPFARSNCRYNV